MTDKSNFEKSVREIEIVSNEANSDETDGGITQYTIVEKIGSFVGSYNRIFEINIVLVDGKETVEILRKGSKKTKKILFEKSDCPKLAKILSDIDGTK